MRTAKNALIFNKKYLARWLNLNLSLRPKLTHIAEAELRTSCVRRKRSISIISEKQSKNTTTVLN